MIPSTTSDNNTNPPPARRTAGQLLIAPVSGWPAPNTYPCGGAPPGSDKGSPSVLEAGPGPSSNRWPNSGQGRALIGSGEPGGLAGFDHRSKPRFDTASSRFPSDDASLPTLSVTAARGLVLPDSLAALSFRTKTVPIGKSPVNFITRNAEVTEDPVSDEQEFKFSEQQSFAYGASDEWRGSSR